MTHIAQAASQRSAAEGGFGIVEETRRTFIPHISYFGFLDTLLGIDHFWSDKFIALLLYLQRFAMILMWNVGWPQLYRKYSSFYYGFLLDFSAKPDGMDSLGKGTILEGCGTMCRLVWPLVCVPVVLTWAGISLLHGTTLYHTRNIERVLWSVMRVGLLPFCSMLVRYFILNQEGNLDHLGSKWSTPTSELGVVFLVMTVSLFAYLGIQRCKRQILFRSTVRHEAYLKTRELEYRLRLSATYRNERIWMISSYVFEAWFWSVARGVVDVLMLFIINFVPPKTGVILGDLILFVYFMYGFVFDIYRCSSTNHMEHVYNCTLFIYCVLATIQANGITSTWLVDTQLDYFLLSVGGMAVGVTTLMGLYYFFDSHRILGLSVAERRANEKWRRIFGTAGGKYMKMQSVVLRTMSAKELEESKHSASAMSGPINEASFRRTSLRSGVSQLTASDKPFSQQSGAVELDDDHRMLLAHSVRSSALHGGGGPSQSGAQSQASSGSPSASGGARLRRAKKIITALKKSNEGDDSFYVPRSGGFMSIDNGSPHVWPVNDGVINELLRMNQENHLVDMLRAGRSMLDRISALHSTAMLIPIDELKTHIFRLHQCVAQCVRYRITHHCNLIHPLQAIFEDLIEQFTYELRIFSGVSITVGHNAKKMINVSRELRIKQMQRDHVLALVSPLMRRVLVKLLALRLFIQLLIKEERRTLLGRPLADEDQGDDFNYKGKRRLPGDVSSDSDDSVLQPNQSTVKGREADTQGREAAEFVEDDPFAEPEEIDPFADHPGENGVEYGNEQQVFADLRGVESDDEAERETELVALLAQEAKKLIKHK